MGEYSAHLPQVSDSGCYEMRLESIGGLGANLCGKLLGELGAAYLGFNASAFSSYGSEKRGSPVKAFVRWGDAGREILHNSPVERPQLLALFHEALARSHPVTAGFGENSVIVINTASSPEMARDALKLCGGTVCCVNALDLSLKSKSRLNMVMLGAICKASGFIPLAAAKELVSDSLGKKYPAVLQSNLAGLEAGFDAVQIKHFEADGKYPYITYEEEKGKWGYKNAPIGGVNPLFGSTVSNDLSASREGYIPLFLPEKCIQCGLCDSACPDMVFQFMPGEFKGKAAMCNRGLDYHHCKGCLRCVNVCPTGALVQGKEAEQKELRHFVRNKDLIAKHIDFETAGAEPWINEEAYLDEIKVDGGLM